MKASIVSMFLFLFCNWLSAQQFHLPKDKPLTGSFTYSYLQLDVNYLHYPIKNTNTNGFSVSGAAVFGNRLATGLGLDVTDSRNMTFVQKGVEISNIFEYSQLSFYNEVFFHPDSRIDISLPLKLGLGHATVSVPENFTFGETLFSSKNKIVDDYFFVSELGVNASVHLLRSLDFNIGGSYRLTAGANSVAIDDDFFNYSIHAGLRFRIGGRK